AVLTVDHVDASAEADAIGAVSDLLDKQPLLMEVELIGTGVERAVVIVVIADLRPAADVEARLFAFRVPEQAVDRERVAELAHEVIVAGAGAPAADAVAAAGHESRSA